ncbi:LacI family DNA-binding transcriptional regulator [Halodurantibacterium flavum]|uniref:LacI family DNA-binding transcriptional regulator n=1 Tax=Halodurantibacterium flavum TaxID=1382802 RepID=A0ABW4RZM7_9RHOB
MTDDPRDDIRDDPAAATLTAQGSGPRFVSAQDVARRAGVSRSAVSRCFTPGASIAPETRRRVLEAAAALGYQVNDLARGLLASRSRLVGLVVTNPELGFRAYLVAALSQALIRRGSVPVLVNTGRSPAEMEAARAILFGHRAEATIVLSGSPPADFVEAARQNGQALVVIGRDEPGCDTLRIDGAGAAARAAALFAQEGRRHLALIGSASDTPTLRERETAFLAAARDLGLGVTHLRGPDSDHAGGHAAAVDLPRDTDAVFCVNDLMAFGLIDRLRRAGRTIPRDLSVIGFDDLPESRWGAYDLSSFRQDPAAMAAAAIRLLDRRQAEPAAPPLALTLPAPFVARATTLLKGTP